MATLHHPTESLKSLHETVAANIDPLGVAMPLVHAQLAWLSHPQELAEALAAVSTKMAALQWYSWQRALGRPAADIEKPHPDDRRFADPVWQDSATWDITKEWYLAATHHVQTMLYETPGLSGKERRRAAFWSRKWLNAMAPTNFLWTNPVAMHKAMESNGDSLIRGMRNFLDDLRAGTVRMTGPEHFQVGGNLATTPGKVVYRNRLLEVIHYTPTQAQVHPQPLVIVTPWINKYYILDLNQKKSMVRYLLDQGIDVYITSWKNPDATMRDVTFDDYIVDGIDRIVQVAREISGATQVHVAGYCIGGAALAAYMAWANRRASHGGEHANRRVIDDGEHAYRRVTSPTGIPSGHADFPVASCTFLTTLVDYHKPGDIEVFLDEGSVRWLSRSMEEKGFLDGKEMATAFRLLRSNSLIWHYVVHGYLYGEAPPPFDVLYWNMDTTRMPAAMHTWYLRNFYLDNSLIKKDALTVAGEQLDLERITQPAYVVSAEDDHIAPWRQTFRIHNFLAGPKRNVLSSSGHILGIVNPPVSPPKREYWVGNAERHDRPDNWRSTAAHQRGSWWEDWMAWLKPMAGKPGAPPAVATKAYPALADAPGTYVRES